MDADRSRHEEGAAPPATLATAPGRGAGSSRHWREADAVSPAVDRAFATLWDHLVVQDVPVASDAIFCFGSRDDRIVPVTAGLFGLGVAPLVLVTGGVDPGRGSGSEGERLAAALVGAGVPRDRIVVERRARHTWENVALGMDSLRRHVAVRRLIQVSWPLAARRCRATFAAVSPSTGVTSVPALPRAGAQWGPTWRRIGLALNEVDKIERYSRSGDIAPEAVPAAVRRAASTLRAATVEAGTFGSAALDLAPSFGPATSGPSAAQISAHDPALAAIEASRSRLEAEETPLTLVER